MPFLESELNPEISVINDDTHIERTRDIPSSFLSIQSILHNTNARLLGICLAIFTAADSGCASISRSLKEDPDSIEQISSLDVFQGLQELLSEWPIHKEFLDSMPTSGDISADNPQRIIEGLCSLSRFLENLVSAVYYLRDVGIRVNSGLMEEAYEMLDQGKARLNSSGAKRLRDFHGGILGLFVEDSDALQEMAEALRKITKHVYALERAVKHLEDPDLRTYSNTFTTNAYLIYKKPFALQQPDQPKPGLTKGAQGDDVRRLQQYLIDFGLLPFGADDGDFGSKTATALAQAQRAVHAKSGTNDSYTAGILDEVTLRYFKSTNSSSSVKCGRIPRGTSIGDIGLGVKALQEKLIHDRALRIRKTDSDFGQGTRQALMRIQTNWQKDDKLIFVSGRVDAVTCNLLKQDE